MRKKIIKILIVVGMFCGMISCWASSPAGNQRIRIVIDTDTNNELDDQHALAYAFLNQDVFEIAGITVNNTENGAGILGQYREAQRILRLFNLEGQIPLLVGADKSYDEIATHLQEPDFDGQPAVDFIVHEAMASKKQKLVLLAIGKLTNVALVLKKQPAIASRLRVVWLGSNYPSPGEYNLMNDTSAVNPVLESGVEFEMVTVRYGQPSGTGAVTVTRDEIIKNMKGRGPQVKKTVEGRHGGYFTCFGDYSVDLFDHATRHGKDASRALFDMAAVAIMKNPEWGQKKVIPAPRLTSEGWIQQPHNSRRIAYWEHFNGEAIVKDLFRQIELCSEHDE